MRAIMKYPGSKWSIAKWIIDFFPEHHSYLEPFFGSGAVLFNKPRSHIETVNDLDGNVVNLFEWIKSDPERLAHEIYYTPYARQVYEDAFSMVPE
ncbi:MAG: DNA adenine methylase, partial [Lachnospiraceae bacterium]|nr:DNA adenine methylase [Lachnospiraceae bacterium]